MTNWILTSCILIVAVIALRAIFKGRISMRMRYGLWALVLIRLLIPGNFIPSHLSVENLALSFSQQPQIQEFTQEWNAPQQSYESVYQEVVQEHYQAYYPEIPAAPATPPEALTATLPEQEQVMIQQEAQKRVEQSTPIYNLTQILTGIWILGALIAGTVLLTINWDFSRRLKLTRRAVEANAPIPVYKSFMAETPCLFGLIHPVIYITEETAADPVALSHILAHESTHYRHKDHIWAFLRSICLILHWYNPLVWLAVTLSKRDCELACDEATIAQIGEEHRIPYGKTLISITCIKRAPSAMLLTATTMLSDKKTLTERIQQVAKKPKVVISAVVAAVIIAAVAVGCTFTGAPEESTETGESTETIEATKSTEPTEPVDYAPITPTHGVQGYLDYFLISYNGNLYTAVSNSEALPDNYTMVGSVLKNDNTTVPAEDFSGCHMQIGIEVYASQSDDTFVYVGKPGASAYMQMLRTDLIEDFSFPEETYPSHTVFFGDWIYRSLGSSDLTIRTAIENLQNQEDILSVYHINISDDKEQASSLAEKWLSDGTAEKNGFTAEFLKNDFMVYNAYYAAEYADSAKNGMYKVTFVMIQEGNEGRWKLWDATEPEKYAELPSDDPLENSEWEYEPNMYASAAIREALNNLVGNFGVESVDILSIDYDSALTDGNRQQFASSQLAKDLKLSKDDIQYFYNVYTAIVMIKSDATSPTRYGTATYCFGFQMLDIPDRGGWHIIGQLMPYIVDDPTPYEISLSNFREFFDSSTLDGRIRQMALTSFYSNPSLVDLSQMFYGDLSKGQLTDAEKTFLTGKGFELNMSVQSHSTDEINSALKLAFGLTLDDTTRTGLDQLTYFKDTDSYYSNHNSTNFPGITITRFEILESGNVALYYIPANMYVAGYENQEFIVTVSRNQDGSIRILSNSLPDGNNTEDAPRFPDAPSNTEVKALPENVQLSDLVKPYWEQGIKFVASDTYYIAIPEIYPFNQAAIDCNRVIYSLFAKELQSHINYLIDYHKQNTRYFDISGADPSVGQTNGGTFYYGYTASYQDGMLSIVVIIDDVHSGRETYHTFNLSVPSGQISTGAQPSREAIKATLKAAFEEMYAKIDSNLDFYQENLKKTLSDENIDACVLSYAEDGTPQITAWIYTFGSVDKVQKILPVLTLTE